MKSRISFFNPTVLKKDITRFAPVWGLHSVFSLLMLLLFRGIFYNYIEFATSVRTILSCMGVVNFIYGGISALCLFGDLFQSRMAGMLHAMPLRREGWFLTHFTAGMLFCIVPNTVVALLACTLLEQYFYLAFVWLLVMILQFFVFFAIGAFAAQCAGTRLGAFAVYGLLNFFSLLLAYFHSTFYVPNFYGLLDNTDFLSSFSPVVNFSTLYINNNLFITNSGHFGITSFDFIWENWRDLLIYVGVAAVLLSLAVLMYRRRHMENAGDFIAFKPAAPVFLTIYTLFVGASIYLFFSLFSQEIRYFFLLVGFAVGFFTGNMLLEKKVNVFQPKKWLRFAIFYGIFFATIAITWIDPFGTVSFVPTQDQIKSVRISNSTYTYDDMWIPITESQSIDLVLELHEKAIETRAEENYTNVYLRIQYDLKDGRTIDRGYYLDARKTSKGLASLFSSFSYVTGSESISALTQNAYSIEFHPYDDQYPSIMFGTKADHAQQLAFETQAEADAAIQGLAVAINTDCNEAKLAQIYEMHSTNEAIGQISICYKVEQHFEYTNITVFEDSTNTVKYLKNLVNNMQ